MAAMNMSLPDQMKAIVEEQAKDGRYSNSSDYLRDLIRRDQERRQAISEIQALVDEAMAFGIAIDGMSQEDASRYIGSRSTGEVIDHSSIRFALALLPGGVGEVGILLARKSS